MSTIIHPGLGDVWYVCGNCQSYRIIVREEDSMEEKKAIMAAHAKPCRREKGATPR